MLQPEPEAEARARELLREHFVKLKYWRPDDSVAASMAIEGADARFHTLREVSPAAIARGGRILVSGMGPGSEMLAARRQGFAEVYGTEVDPFYIELCQVRFRGLTGLHPCHYDGGRAPFDDGFFDLVVSGHIIEHTGDPFAYLTEQLRVLAKGGTLLLEFPTRYHWTELHTQLPSFEWLPTPVRNRVLRLLGGRLSPLPEGVKYKCNTIVDTGLKQVSTGGVRRWLRRSGFGTRVTHLSRPAPGVVRLVIERI